MAFKLEPNLFKWDPNSISISVDQSSIDQNFAVIVLNHGLDDLDATQLKHFNFLWRSVKFRLSVDGATNKLLEIGESYVPDCISGDFDSITGSTLNHFKDLKVETIETPDQNYTDFIKSLFVLNDKINAKQLSIDFIVTVWQANHRLDQTFSVISAVHRWLRLNPKCPVILFDLKGSLSWLLPKGTHEIRSNKISEWCSVVPFDGEASVTSTGLLYDMNRLTLSYNEMVSTSNGFDGSMDKVTIQVHDKPVLWSQHLILK